MKIQVTDIDRVYGLATAELAMTMMNRYFVEFDIPAIASLEKGSVEIDTSLEKCEIEKVYAVVNGVCHALRKIRDQ